MIDWLKRKLGIDQLQTQLTTLQEERDELKATVERKNEILDDMTEELNVFRKQEAADKAKYESSDPWVEIRSADFSDVRGIRIELDWNQAFVEHLKTSGIKGANEEEVVQKWLAFLYQDLIEKLEAKVIDKKDEKGTVSDYV